MSEFKISKKQIHTDTRMSIIAKHDKTIHDIENEKKNLQKYKKELILLKKTEGNEEKILSLTDKIKKIENEEDLTDYLFKAIDFIKDIENIELQHSVNENFDGEIAKYITLDSKNNKEILYKKYMRTCFPLESKEALYIPLKTCFICKECGHNLTRDPSVGLNLCYNCSYTEICNVSNTSEWNQSETHEFIKPYCYKRTNHFKEWIAQTQGVETSNIPDEITNLILGEIKKERINDKKDITYHKVKEFLKKLKLNKYYEHIPNIIIKITGNKRLSINTELQKKLENMFNEIQEPFERHCPKSRKNFLSYSYTLHKFFQILDKNEYLIYFPLLKSREKLFEQEEIWKNICKDLGWKFISSI